MDNILKQIRDNWLILGFLVTVVMTWATFNSRLADAEATITDLKQVVTQINQININIAVIQERLTTINNKLGQ